MIGTDLKVSARNPAVVNEPNIIYMYVKKFELILFIVEVLTSSQSFVPKKCRTSTFQKSFFIRTTRIWNLLITRLDLDNVTFENFKSVLYSYYSRALTINYDPDSPRSFKSICLKCNTARFLDQEISCCM